MLDDGMEALLVLARIVRVWRQLFIGKGLSTTRSAREVAAAAGVPSLRPANLSPAAKKYEWKQLAAGFRELLNLDRALNRPARTLRPVSMSCYGS